MYSGNENDFIGTGWHFPIAADKVTGHIMECSYEDSIRQSIYLIVMTKKGERVMRPDFGCDIHQYMFAALDYTTLTMMRYAVEEALVRWEPRIKDINVKVENRMQKESVIQIEIAYRVRTTNNPFNLVFPFYLQET